MRRTLPRGAARVPAVLIVLGVALVGTGWGMGLTHEPDALAVDLDCTSIRESRRKLRKCLDNRDALRLAAARRALATLDSHPSPVDRDLLRLRLAARSPRLAETICGGVETEEGTRLCDRLTGRPHLYAVEDGWVLREEAQNANRERTTSSLPSSSKRSRD